MALIATRWAREGRLAGDTLVATVMSNLGLERHLAAQGIALKRTPVGDRHVVEAMRAGGFNLGGEQSGHIVMTDYATTGDGLIGALQFLAAMVETGQRASELVRVFEPVPQRLVNVRFAEGKTPLKSDIVQNAVAEAEAELGSDGRLLLRASGTEPLIRVMAEAIDPGMLDRVMARLVGAVEAAS
jgi:phosphoglucosamine mutase